MGRSSRICWVKHYVSIAQMGCADKSIPSAGMPSYSLKSTFIIRQISISGIPRWQRYNSAIKKTHSLFPTKQQDWLQYPQFPLPKFSRSYRRQNC